MVPRCVRYRNLLNEKVLPHLGVLCQKQTKPYGEHSPVTFVTPTSRLMLVSEIIIFYCKKNKEDVNVLCSKTMKYLMLKEGSVH